MRSGAHSIQHRALAVPVIAVAGATLLFAGCSSSTKTASATGSGTTTGSSTTSGAPAMNEAAITVSVANVPGVGTVLVNGEGRTLYVLVGEKGGKVTCSSAGGCTTIWPAVVLPSGTAHGIAGSGVQASLLGTVTGPSGDVRLTYAGWPLYTFAPDTAPGQAKGQGVKDSFGLWWVLSPTGNPITTTAASSSPTAAPATSPPATSPPATSPPATSPPPTSPPSTSPPTTSPSSGGAGF